MLPPTTSGLTLTPCPLSLAPASQGEGSLIASPWELLGEVRQKAEVFVTLSHQGRGDFAEFGRGFEV
ncbi:MAG: hypothetical protein KF784_02740 [Fimbriimonadaceae bacterium]|nr:hypothetical protein [Fimbriimonadaceae bacterium]